MIKFIMLFACAFAALLAEDAFAQEQPPQSLEEEFRSLPIEEQSRRLTLSAEAGVVFFFTTEAFSLLASDKAFHQYMDMLVEPVAQAWLDALEGLLKQGEYADARFRAAVLLFRHGRASGLEHLLDVLRQASDLRAALVLAVAQEHGTERAIVDAILTALATRKSLNRLNDAIIRWNNEAIVQALSQPQVRSAFEARSALASYARLLGAADAESSTSLRQLVFDTSHHISTRLELAAAAVRRNPDDVAARGLLLEELVS